MDSLETLEKRHIPMRFLLTPLILSLAVGFSARAGESPVTGNWKVTILNGGQLVTLCILHLESKGGKLEGKNTPLRDIVGSTVTGVKVEGDLLKFDMKLDKGPRFAFEGKLPGPGAKKIFGAVNQRIPAVLEATRAKDQFELDREMVLQTPYDPRVFNTVLELVEGAKGRKEDPKEVQEWVETALRSAENYGAGFYDTISLRLLDALAKDYPESAVTIGRKMEAGLDPKAPLFKQLRLLGWLSPNLKKVGQEAQAAKLDARIEKLEGAAYADYQKTAIEFPVAKFAGRKGKSSRAVLVELFTGSQCPPCVAADVAFDAVEKSYKATDVVLLQYHLHIPGPDPLTNPATEERQEYYGGVVRGTPAVLFNGKPGAPGGGGRDAAQEKFEEFQSVINPLLEKDTAIKLTASAVRKGEKVMIQAKAENVDNPGEKVRLRLALVEDWVRYRSPNGLMYHHRVVRNMPLGTKGTALVKKDSDVSASVDIAEIQTALNKYLDDFARKEEPFPDAQRPLRLRELHLVAFVQDDATSEVLQAIDVPVRDE